GLITLEKLKEHLQPIRDKLALLQEQIKAEEKENQPSEKFIAPDSDQISAFTEKASVAIRNLSFESKKAIIKEVIEKVVSTQKELSVYGFIPVSNLDNGLLCSEYRHCWVTKCGQEYSF
ncbi:MAG: hypothetical protein AAB681_02810, partial [Patescibacteria group bacterium]